MKSSQQEIFLNFKNTLALNLKSNNYTLKKDSIVRLLLFVEDRKLIDIPFAAPASRIVHSLPAAKLGQLCKQTRLFANAQQDLVEPVVLELFGH